MIQYLMFEHINAGQDSPKIVNVIVEIPKNTHNKYEYDEKIGVIKLDRVLHSPMHYPVDYGFVPSTRSLDGDHLDAMVITNSPVFTGCVLEVRVLGCFIMSDEHGLDEKIIAVPKSDPYFNHFKKFKDISPHLLRELEHFFTQYKTLEGKKVKMEGWKNRLDTCKIIRAAQKRYLAEKGN